MNTGELTVGWRIAQLLPLFTALVSLVKFVAGAESRLSTIICWLGVLCRNVVFPAPLGPRMARISPASTQKLMSLKMGQSF